MQHTELKLVLAGPVGAGKTTVLRALSDIAPVSTEMPLTDGAMGEKTTTTVALDFAAVMLEDGTPLQLFGLPGQAHFSHMRPIVMAGAIGVIVLLPGDDPRIAEQCAHWLSIVAGIDPEMAVVIGITRTDLAADFRIDRVRQAAIFGDVPVPVFTIDARDREQAGQLVRALLLSLD